MDDEKEMCINKINEANILLQTLDSYKRMSRCPGLEKLKKKINTEITFLAKALKDGVLKREHIKCSNLTQLQKIAQVAINSNNLSAILCSVNAAKSKNSKNLVVDIVYENGTKWKKVILRNPSALHFTYMTGGKGNTRPLTVIAKDFILASSLNTVLFQPPKVCFYFACGVSESLAAALIKAGVDVEGEILCDNEMQYSELLAMKEDDQEKEEEGGKEIGTCDQKKENQLHRTVAIGITLHNDYNSVNLDVTSLIAYCTATANGAANFVFKDSFLSEQAKCERQRPVKPILESYFKDRQLIVCYEAAEHFKSILHTIGGPGERDRGRRLLQQCTIVPSQDILQELRLSGRVKFLSRQVFGTGHYQRAPTVTSNSGFVRAAQCQGINITVLLHEPRALTELKEESASPI